MENRAFTAESFLDNMLKLFIRMGAGAFVYKNKELKSIKTNLLCSEFMTQFECQMNDRQWSF